LSFGAVIGENPYTLAIVIDSGNAVEKMKISVILTGF
jgi:chemotaxis methyl-accepting protein methylase